MPTPVKNLDNMSKHLTKDELEARAAAQALGLPCRKPKKPKLITQDKAASRHWARILKDMQDLEILDVLDTDALAIYCAKLSRRDRLQEEYLRLIAAEDLDLNVIRSSVKLSEALQSAVEEVRRSGGDTIRIATFKSVAVSWLPAMMKAFQAEHPEAEFRLFDGAYAEVDEYVRTGAVDFGFVSLPDRAPRSACVQTIDSPP